MHACFASSWRRLLAFRASRSGRSLFLYDMPNTKEIAERLYARFQRVGRKSALTAYAFVPNCALGPVINRAVQISDLEALFSEGP